MLLPVTRGENLCSSRKVTNKSENILAYATGSAWTLMSIELYTTVLVAFHPGFQLKVPQYTIHRHRLHSDYWLPYGSKNNKTKLKLEKDYGSIVTVYKCTEKISNDIWAIIL